MRQAEHEIKICKRTSYHSCCPIVWKSSPVPCRTLPEANESWRAAAFLVLSRLYLPPYIVGWVDGWMDGWMDGWIYKISVGKRDRYD